MARVEDGALERGRGGQHDRLVCHHLWGEMGRCREIDASRLNLFLICRRSRCGNSDAMSVKSVPCTRSA